MIDLRASLQAGTKRALDTNDDSDWAYVDSLAIELSKRCVGSIQDLRMIVEHAIRRLGGIPGERPFSGPSTETWLEHVLSSVRKGLEGVETLHSSFEMPVLLHSIGSGSKLVCNSQTWCRLLGYSNDEVLGRCTVDFLTEESKKSAHEIWLPQFWATGSVNGAKYEFLTKGGRKIPVELSATAERDKNGVITRSFAIISLC